MNLIHLYAVLNNLTIHIPAFNMLLLIDHAKIIFKTCRKSYQIRLEA